MLNPCVKQIICTLSFPVLVALKAVIVGVQTQLQAFLAVLEARSLTLGIQLLPTELARDAANAVLQEAESVANLIPVGLIDGCVDLGGVQQDISSAMRQATAGVNDFADAAAQALSLQAATADEIASIRAKLDRLSAFNDVIDECINEAA